MDAPAFAWSRASDRLGAWSYYFAAKAALFALGLIDLHLVENLVRRDQLDLVVIQEWIVG